MAEKSKKGLARKACANWFNGNCVGCDMYVDENDVLHFFIDARFAEKPCQIDTEEGCQYFERVVVPGLPSA